MTITVTAVNDPPVANEDSATVLLGTVEILSVSSNDTDVDDNLDLASVNTDCSLCFQPNGTLVNNGDGTFDYSPRHGLINTDSFVYEICDTEAACAAAQVSILVLLTNSPRIARDDRFEGTRDTPMVLVVDENDVDPDGNLDSGSANTDCDLCSVPIDGSLINNGDGSFDYTPDSRFEGSDGFVYEICDTLGACASATVLIEVAAGDPNEVFVDGFESGDTSRWSPLV